MSDVAIRAEGLSKQYRIGGERAAYQTFREALVAGAKRPLRRLRGEKQEPNTIWALDDVSFEVKHGEAVGIIGRNGAGKSTLLKILSRITRPTRGRVDLYGRVGSLLEVGTGFHPELTGRENIYLNGAILGMTRREIERKFDEIVDFSEIEKFLDTPVKHYSSGMYVRLAFAVAAHLEPEILVVDEVLAVGDAAFQKKCLGKMGDVAHEGRTVLFVSHNMAAVKRLCQSSILLGSGKVVRMGETEALVDDYLSTHQETRSYENLAISEAPICLRKMELHSNEGDLLQRTIEAKDGFVVYLEYEINRPLQGVHAFLRIHLPDGETLFSSGDTDTRPDRIGWRTPGSYKCELSIPPKILNEGIYTITWSAGVPHQINYDVKFHIISFRIIDNTSSRMDYVHERRPGYLALDLDWNYLDRDPASN